MDSLETMITAQEFVDLEDEESHDEKQCGEPKAISTEDHDVFTKWTWEQMQRP